jgi:3-phenylpropionate/trans-cinnamate dioxygenase ferredoxin subunit
VTAMGSYIEVGKTAEFQDGTRKKVSVSGQEIMLARVGDRYYAVGNRCPHLGGDLAAGKLEGTIVTCPRHGSQFDITDGRTVRWLKGAGLVAALGKAIKSPRSLPTYQVKIDGDTIYIEV